MTLTKDTAVISVILAGVVLLASFIYQSGFIQKLEQNRTKLLSVDAQNNSNENSLITNNLEPPLSNPDGNVAIAIIRAQPKPLEELILDALDKGYFEYSF